MKNRWGKRVLITVGVVILLGVIAALAGVALLQRTPQWYEPLALDADQRAQAAQNVLNKVVETRDMAAQAQAQESATQHAQQTGHSVSAATQPIAHRTFSFSQNELNAFMLQWSDPFKARYEQYLRNPILALRNGQIIFGAQVAELGTVASFHLKPSVDRDAMRLDLISIRGGALPLPQQLVDEKLNKIRNLLQQRLPRWQEDAKIDPTGQTNRSAVAASMAKLVLAALDHESVPPVLFLPNGDDQTLPVRITDMQVTDGTMTITVQPMSPEERQNLLTQIREPYSLTTSLGQ